MRTAQVLFAVVCLGIMGMNIQAQSVWLADSMQRVGPSDASSSGSSISVYAAKGESQSFQVVVKAPGSGLTINNVTASNLAGPSGASISQQSYTFYREYYVDVTQPSPDFGVGNRPLGAGWYPDALIPFKDPQTGQPLGGATYNAVPYSLSGNQNQPFWVDITVPRTATAGTYTGTVTVSTSKGSFTTSVTLTVWNFSLPVASHLKSSFGYHGSLGNLGDNEVLLQNRVQPFTITPSDLPTLQSQGAETVGLPFFNESSGCTIEVPPSSAVLANAASAYPSGFPTYVYPADEVNGCPNLAQNLQLWAKAAHAAGVKTLVTVVPDPSLLNDGTGSGRSDVDIWAMLPKQYCANIGQLPCAEVPSIATVLAKGDQIWSYSEQEQDYYSPKWLIDFAPVNYRMLPGFLNQQFGFTGMIYSDVAHWSSDPWNDVQSWQAAGYTFPGDDMLVYPGQEVGASSVVPSMRLKYIRDGVNDYDYIALLKSQGQQGLVNQILASVAPDWINWSKNPSAIEAARIQMGQELDRLGGGSGSGSGGGTTGLQSPTNPWPSSGSSGIGTSLNLQWSSVSGATQYEVYFGDTATDMSLWATLNAPTTSYAIHNLGSNVTYYWKIVALGGGSSASSAVWNFRTN